MLNHLVDISFNMSAILGNISSWSANSLNEYSVRLIVSVLAVQLVSALFFEEKEAGIICETTFNHPYRSPHCYYNGGNVSSKPEDSLKHLHETFSFGSMDIEVSPTIYVFANWIIAIYALLFGARNLFRLSKRVKLNAVLVFVVNVALWITFIVFMLVAFGSNSIFYCFFPSSYMYNTIDVIFPRYLGCPFSYSGPSGTLNYKIVICMLPSNFLRSKSYLIFNILIYVDIIFVFVQFIFKLRYRNFSRLRKLKLDDSTETKESADLIRKDQTTIV
jgi:hypothetical protein